MKTRKSRRTTKAPPAAPVKSPAPIMTTNASEVATVIPLAVTPRLPGIPAAVQLQAYSDHPWTEGTVSTSRPLDEKLVSSDDTPRSKRPRLPSELQQQAVVPTPATTTQSPAGIPIGITPWPSVHSSQHVVLTTTQYNLITQSFLSLQSQHEDLTKRVAGLWEENQALRGQPQEQRKTWLEQKELLEKDALKQRYEQKLKLKEMMFEEEMKNKLVQQEHKLVAKFQMQQVERETKMGDDVKKKVEEGYEVDLKRGNADLKEREGRLMRRVATLEGDLASLEETLRETVMENERLREEIKRRYTGREDETEDTVTT